MSTEGGKRRTEKKKTLVFKEKEETYQTSFKHGKGKKENRNREKKGQPGIPFNDPLRKTRRRKLRKGGQRGV